MMKYLMPSSFQRGQDLLPPGKICAFLGVLPCSVRFLAGRSAVKQLPCTTVRALLFPNKVS